MKLNLSYNIPVNRKRGNYHQCKYEPQASEENVHQNLDSYHLLCYLKNLERHLTYLKKKKRENYNNGNSNNNSNNHKNKNIDISKFILKWVPEFGHFSHSDFSQKMFKKNKNVIIYFLKVWKL